MSKVSSLLKATHKDPAMIIGITLEAKVSEAAKLMVEKNVGSLLVMNGEHLVGIITERDMVKKLVAYSKNADVVPVFEVMTWNPDTVSPLEDVMDVMILMERKGFRHVPVVEKDKVIGIISIRDILVALVRHQELIAMNLMNYITGPGS